jgi:hypothetical protein
MNEHGLDAVIFQDENEVVAVQFGLTTKGNLFGSAIVPRTDIGDVCRVLDPLIQTQ